MSVNRRSFLQEVKSQLSSKEAKLKIEAELDDHLLRTKQSWIEKGLEEQEAETKAVLQMGSPTLLGKQLNKLHRPKVDWLLIGLLLTILSFGLLSLFTLSRFGYSGFSFSKAVVSVIIGLCVSMIMMFIDYRKIRHLGWLFYLAGAGILIVIHFFFNITINGRAYLSIASFAIDSTMAIPFFLLAWASFFSSQTFRIWKFLLLFLLSLFLLLQNSTLSIIYLYSVTVFIMLWWSPFTKKSVIMITFSTLALVGTSSVILWGKLMIYQKMRFLAFLHPDVYDNSTLLLAHRLIREAGWFGHAISKSALSSPQADLVFVSFTYMFGWILAGILVLLMILLTIRMFYVLPRIQDSYGKRLLAGAAALYTIQLLSNLGMVVGFFPIITLALPFISYGLTPMLLNSFLIGIALSVYRRKDLHIDYAK
ncbi:FtsW/RodA/SpoVE family cell cycle protein [Priestia koreensis]|uniref:FtsW/RodA/SpoVE family cell cycle protein n=1 Tax=Priestia koreensis TaxID=284581 RepID=UPI00203DC7E2|nr:FtsW/RodA/SpoVE family cell cycle protein [Priestia koreensis]MCM3004292.1 FtsW/RodA/SpoVE family cell cycle protein [Priestia koreensis]